MSAKNRVTDYMKKQFSGLDAGEISELIDKSNLTAEQRKEILKKLGDVTPAPKEPAPAPVRNVCKVCGEPKNKLIPFEDTCNDCKKKMEVKKSLPKKRTRCGLLFIED